MQATKVTWVVEDKKDFELLKKKKNKLECSLSLVTILGVHCEPFRKKCLEYFQYTIQTFPRVWANTEHQGNIGYVMTHAHFTLIKTKPADDQISSHDINLLCMY